MSGNEQGPQGGGGFLGNMREGLRAWGAGEPSGSGAKAPVPITWLGPEGPIDHEFTDHILEAVMHSGGRIPDTVGLSPRDRGVVLGAAGIMGVVAPEAARRLGGRQARRGAGLTGEQAGDSRRTKIWLPSADDVAASLEMGETAGGLVVAAHLLERHRPPTNRVVRPAKNLGTRALGGLVDLRPPYQDQFRLREVVDDIVVRAYGRDQKRGLGIQGDDDEARSIQSPLLWARAVELSGARHCADGLLLSRMQGGFEASYRGHRRFHEEYPSQLKQLHEDILGARLAAQFDRYELLHTINSLMVKDDLDLVAAAQKAGVRFREENYREVVLWLNDNLRDMRQFIGLMKKDGLSAEQAAVRLGRRPRPIPAEVRVRITGDHAERMGEKRAQKREARLAAQAAVVAERELRARRKELAHDSAEDYVDAVLADPVRLADEARNALTDGDTDDMTTYVMALFEQMQVGVNRAGEEMRRLWPQVAAPAIEALHVKIGDVRRGVASLGELLLIDNLDTQAIKNSDLRTKASELKRAFNDAAFSHYGYRTISSPVDPGEMMDFEKGENIKQTPYGGVTSADDAAAIRAGFIYDRRNAAGPPVAYDVQQAELLGLLEARWGRELLRAAEGADPRILPRQLQVDLAQLEEWAAKLRKGQKLQRIEGFWHLVKEEVIKKGLTEYTNPLRRKDF